MASHPRRIEFPECSHLTDSEFLAFLDTFDAETFIECSNMNCGRQANKKTDKRFSTCCGGCGTASGHRPNCNAYKDITSSYI